MSMSTYEIEYMDGKKETVQYVESAAVTDSVLSLFRDRPYSGGREHLGSYPIANIRKWTRVER